MKLYLLILAFIISSAGITNAQQCSNGVCRVTSGPIATRAVYRTPTQVVRQTTNNLTCNTRTFSHNRPVKRVLKFRPIRRLFSRRRCCR